MTSDICINRLVIILVYFYINLYIFLKLNVSIALFNIALELLGFTTTIHGGGQYTQNDSSL